MVRQRVDQHRHADAVTTAVDLAAYDAVVLDFDGPMCNVFAGYAAAKVADELKDLVVAQGWPADEVAATSDPHQILRLVHTLAPELFPTVELALTAAELAAVETATITPDLAALITHLRSRRLSVAVASNNNADAIQSWLDRHRLEVDYVCGRDPHDPTKMKPAPDILLQAVAFLGLQPQQVVFLGDGASDAQAAYSAGTAFIGFANKPHKGREAFFGGHGIATIRHLSELMTTDAKGK